MSTEPDVRIKVFVTDDHQMVIQGLNALLADCPNIHWVGSATDADSCMKALETVQPDVLFLDINLPGKSGIELCLDIKQQYPSVHIIALSSFSQLSYIRKMLQQQASGYILKNATADELVKAIETVMQGGTYLSVEVIEKTASHNPKFPSLTRREQEVLVLIADGLTNVAIAEKLFISQTTVETHRKNLLLKFDTKNTANLIKLAVRFGLIDP